MRALLTACIGAALVCASQAAAGGGGAAVGLTSATAAQPVEQERRADAVGRALSALPLRPQLRSGVLVPACRHRGTVYPQFTLTAMRRSCLRANKIMS